MAAAEISAALLSIPSKKENLRRAFDALQSQSSSFSSFTLSWNDIEDHFSSMERSIRAQLDALQFDPLPSTPAPEISPAPEKPPEPVLQPEPFARPELRTLCARMNGKGLMLFLGNNRRGAAASVIQHELTPAIRSSPDPAALILDAIEWFFPPNWNNVNNFDLKVNRKACLVLLGKMQLIAPEINPVVRDKAKKMALEWKERVFGGSGNDVVKLGFLQLLACYGLDSGLTVDELLDLLSDCGKRVTSDLVKGLGLTKSVPDLIEKLTSNGKHLVAIRLVYAFDLLESHPPVHLLRDFVGTRTTRTRKLFKKKYGSNIYQDPVSATMEFQREIAALKGAIKITKEYNLEAAFPVENLERRLAAKSQECERWRRRGKSQTADPKALRRLRKHSSNQADHHHHHHRQPHPEMGFIDHRASPYMGFAGDFQGAPPQPQRVRGACFVCCSPDHQKRECPVWLGRPQGQQQQVATQAHPFQ